MEVLDYLVEEALISSGGDFKFDDSMGMLSSSSFSVVVISHMEALNSLVSRWSSSQIFACSGPLSKEMPLGIGSKQNMATCKATDR